MLRVDIRELASEIVESLAGRSGSHTVQLETGDDLEVRADPDKLRQVLTNFIENAQKYTDKGTITVRCVREGEWGLVSVTDEGEGIPAREWGTVFEKFARTEVAGAPTGTGLGLYISKGLVEAHKGEIGVTSTEGRGSTFWFRVPVVEDDS
jgi:signal transduction histidine kinase